MCKNVITKVFVVLAVLTLGSYAMAGTCVQWDDGAAGSHLWTDANNWNGNKVPESGDDVRVALNVGGAHALLNSSADLGSCGVCQTLVYRGGILDVDGSSGRLTNWLTAVGYSVGGGLMNVTNGATVTATRSAGTGIYVGNTASEGGASTMNISGAGTIVSAGDEISIALFGGSGTIDVSSGGTLSAGGRLAVGGTGNGTLTINGGTVNSTFDSIIGRNSGANGTVVMNSGAWNVTTASDAGRIIFGAEDGTSGTLNMSGGDINAYKLILGYVTGGVGTANVDGGTITLTRHAMIGLDGGSGTLNVDGGDLSIGFWLYLGHNAGLGDGVGFVQLDSGSIFAYDLIINSLSSMDITEGTLVLGGDHRTQIQGYVDAGQITGYSDPNNVKVHYDDVNEITTVTAVPYVAFNPSPDDGAVVPAEECDTTVLTWSPGSEAASHNVYLGTDFDNVNDANTGSPEYKANKLLGNESYDPGTLEMGTTYYWRIDEVNDTDTWKGNVWSFSVPNYFVIDDFEAYQDPCEPTIAGTWQVSGNALASLATDLSHEGDKSMKVIYSTGIGESAEVSRATPFVDWTQEGIEALTLFFHGVQTNSANAQQLYVKLEDGSANEFTLYYTGDADDIVQDAEEDFVAWDIYLDDFTDVIQTNVTKISIGMDGSSSDTVYYDEIMLYVSRCIDKPAGDISGDCMVDWEDFALLAGSWLESGMWP